MRVQRKLQPFATRSAFELLAGSLVCLQRCSVRYWNSGLPALQRLQSASSLHLDEGRQTLFRINMGGPSCLVVREHLDHDAFHNAVSPPQLI